MPMQPKTLAHQALDTVARSRLADLAFGDRQTQARVFHIVGPHQNGKVSVRGNLRALEDGFILRRLQKPQGLGEPVTRLAQEFRGTTWPAPWSAGQQSLYGLPGYAYGRENHGYGRGGSCWADRFVSWLNPLII